MRRFSITVNGLSYTVDVEELAPGAAPQHAAAAPRTVAPVPPLAGPVTVASPSEAPAAPTGLEVAAGDTVVKAPMPGTVTKLVASVGQPLRKGQVILLLEAMKMQNEIGSPAAGVLKSLSVAQGDSVKPGQLLAVISA